MEQEKLILEKVTRIEKMLSEHLLLAKNVLDFEEAKAYLNLSESHLYKLTSQRRIPHSKPHGKLVYFDRLQLDAWRLTNPVKTINEIDESTSTYVSLNKAG